MIIAVMLFFPAVDIAAALDVPPLKGRVNDYGGILSSATISQLDFILKEFEASDSTQIVVLTIPSLKGDNLERFSLEAAEKWGVGQRGKDNGALLVISRDDRKLRIEVGYGLEGTLTDLVAGRIIRKVIAPQFRQGSFNQGVIDGVDAIIAAVKGEFQQGTNSASGKSDENFDFGALIILIIFFSSFIGTAFRRSKLLAAGVGGVIMPLIGFLFLRLTGLALVGLVVVGMIGGLVASAMASSSGTGSHPRRMGGGFPGGGGGFGGSSGGFGGGGGGFGGGGASGGW
jgi:uncharacterized protein